MSFPTKGFADRDRQAAGVPSSKAPRQMVKPTIFAAALALLAIVAMLVWLATDRPSGVSSRVLAPQAFVEELRPERERCVPYQIVPPGTKAVQLTLGTFGRKVPASVSVVGRDGGRLVLSGTRRFREAQNVNIAISPAPRREQVAEICLRNTGRNTVQVAGQPGAGISIRFLGSRRDTWLKAAGAVAERFRLARVAPFGEATLWFALALSIVALALAILVVVRAGSRDAGERE